MTASPAQDEIRAAVETESVLSRRKLLQKLFAAWFSGFVYNQIWEDPRVDIEALKINRDSRILTISSGGCNALNYLLESPESITAVDLNEHHIRLLELKKVAAITLPDYDSFFEFFGFGRGSNTGTNYYRYIAPKLSKDARNYWESNSFWGNLIFGPRIVYFRDRGLYNHSRNAFFLRFFHRMANLYGLYPERIINAKKLSEQEKIFESEILPFFNSSLIRLAGKLPVTTFGLGIPPQQLDELRTEIQDGMPLTEIYLQRVRKLACAFSIQDNYFAWQAFSRKYDTKNRLAIPEYLKKENFGILKNKSSGLKTIRASFTDVLRSSKHGYFNRFVLLDAQDWMDDTALNQLWSLIADRGQEDSRIIFRTAGSKSPIETRLDQSIRRYFIYEQADSERLSAGDRAAIYGGFHIYVLRKNR